MKPVRATAAPMILAVGIVLMGAGVALGLVLSAVGGVVFIAGLAAWIGHLQPGRGHCPEERVGLDRRPQPIAAAPGTRTQAAANFLLTLDCIRAAPVLICYRR